jgi:tRNA (guanosine-2'-O-)-methyltransferase
MTDERLEKITKVLNHRQYGLGVVLENIEDPHNIAAILRTCDAAGVQDTFIIHTKQPDFEATGWKSSRSATKWMSIHHFTTIDSCFEVLRSRFDMILATALVPSAKSLFETNLTGNVALVFGNEIKGLSETIISKCDGAIIIPQFGMLSSLNISVACAITLYEAMRQRMKVGKFDERSIPDETYDALLKEWTEKRKSNQ